MFHKSYKHQKAHCPAICCAAHVLVLFCSKACYDSLGLEASEVQALAGLKEGCGDEMDFATVMRPPRTTPAAAKPPGSSGWWQWRGGHSSSAGQDDGGGLVPTQVPLGSVRASLGWASTFEDAYALVQFLRGYLS